MKAVIVGIDTPEGYELATTLLRQGWQVAGTYRDNGGPWLTGDDTKPEADLVKCDFCDQQQLAQAYRLITSEYDMIVFSSDRAHARQLVSLVMSGAP